MRIVCAVLKALGVIGAVAALMLLFAVLLIYLPIAGVVIGIATFLVILANLTAVFYQDSCRE